MSVLSRVGFMSLLLGCGLLLALSPPSAQTGQPAFHGAAVEIAPPDSFPHYRHSKLPCLTCHVVKDRSNRVVFESPRGCDLCHHQEAVRGRFDLVECSRCHLKILQPPAVSVATPKSRPVRRQFRHDRHTTTTCATCHAGPKPAPSKAQATCTACHQDHHTARRDCAECHRSADLTDAHAPQTHRGCDECHDAATVARLVPDRGFCITCHENQREHRVEGQCTTCHFQATPTEYQKYLRVKAGP